MLEGILHQCDIDFRISALEDSYSFRKNFFFMYSLKTDTQRTFQPFFRPLGQRMECSSSSRIGLMEV